ncbi:MAG: SPW repeat protein [Sulfuricaulis sp.]|uniref:SPW repeat protein n=1 Tax=Sulfuricaulis sp. TaxID=2003553 RepID=UPI0034A40926
MSGATVAVFSLAAIVRPQLWEEWVNLVVGAWLIVVPFALGYADQTAPMWNQIVLGVLIGADALWAALQNPSQPKSA